MLNISQALHQKIANQANSAVINTLTSGGRRVGRPSGEVAAVKSLLLDAMPRLAALWTRALRPTYRLGLTSVFCHSHPQVTFIRPSTGNPGRCELADLLIVIDHFGPGRTRDRRAVLVQAKVQKSRGKRLHGNELAQYDLLSRWPVFNFIDAARYDALRPRNFRGSGVPPHPRLSGEYGWIDLAAVPRRWDQYLTMRSGRFSNRFPLGPFLAAMACGVVPFGRETLVGGNDDWSWTVQELLDQTSLLPIVKRVPGVLRGRHHGIGFLVAQADTTRAAASLSAAAPGGAGPFGGDRYDGGGGDRGGEVEVEWPAGPISVVHLRLVHMEAEPGEAPPAGRAQQR